VLFDDHKGLLHVSKTKHVTCNLFDWLDTHRCDDHVVITEDPGLHTWNQVFAPVMLACFAIQLFPIIFNEFSLSPLSWSWQAELEKMYLHKDTLEPQQTTRFGRWLSKVFCSREIGSKTFNTVRHSLLKNGAPLLINNMGD